MNQIATIKHSSTLDYIYKYLIGYWSVCFLVLTNCLFFPRLIFSFSFFKIFIDCVLKRRKPSFSFIVTKLFYLKRLCV